MEKNRKSSKMKRTWPGRAIAITGAGSAVACCMLVVLLLLSSLNLGSLTQSVVHVSAPTATGDLPSTDTGANNGISDNNPAWKTYPYKAGHIDFPTDEGVHPEATTEWWYLNGHLVTDDGRQFDYMVCFYTHYFVAAALFDESRGIYINYSKAFTDVKKTSGHLGLIYGEDSLIQVPGKPFSYELTFQYPDYSLMLQLDNNKPPMLINGDGVMNMGRGLSYYYSLTDLTAVAQLRKVPAP